MVRLLPPASFAAALVTATAAPPPALSAFPSYPLQAEEHWFLNLPEDRRFDASGLLKTAAGGLLTLNDRDAGLAQIDFSGNAPHEARLVLTNLFPSAQLTALQQSNHHSGRLDGEGLAADAKGSLYLCEETNRWILRLDHPGASNATVSLLPIDWSPVARYFSTNANASFEGVAVGGDRLYVANERDASRILVVNLTTLQVERDFAVHAGKVPDRDTTIADLCWFEDSLFVLCRRDRCVLKVAPATGKILAAYDYAALESTPGLAYLENEAYGLMEGLAVDATSFWLINDNNGQSRKEAPADKRPLLLRCPRPDRSSK